MVKLAILEMLKDLSKSQLDKFIIHLLDRREGPRIRRSDVEGKSLYGITDLLVSAFTEPGAKKVTMEILELIKCNEQEKKRERKQKQRKDVTPVYPIRRPSTTPNPSSERERESPSPQDRTRQDSDRYKMDAFPCGYCLIINNVEFEKQTKLGNRTGSDRDCKKLRDRFVAFNFIVEERTNLKQEQIKDELSQLSKNDHSQYDCCVVIILSHGNKVSYTYFPGAVYGVDGQLVPVESITNYLQHCPSLQGKPKLFFIQACGGEKKDKGCKVSSDGVEPSTGGADNEMDFIPMSSSNDSPSMSAEPDTGLTPPTPCDILVSYSTFPGYVSWRDHRSGSLYVEALDNILKEYAATDHLYTMLTKVNKKVSEMSAKGIYKQISGSDIYLCKRLYFQTQK